MKRFGLLVSLAALASSLIVTSPAPASAALTYCGDQGNYHDGFRKDTNDTYVTYGVSALVRVQHGDVCTSGDTGQTNFTNAWTMLSSHLGGGWGQTGFIRWYNHLTVHFSQWKMGSCCGAHTSFGATHLSAGELHQYWTLRTSSANCPLTPKCLIGHIDQTTWFYSGFDPADGGWSTPFIQLYEGETGYLESDVPGLSSAKTGYDQMQYVNGSNQWVNQGCGMVAVQQNPVRWDQETVTCGHRRIWTAVP